MHSEGKAKSLQQEINQWKWGVAGAALIAVVAYAVWFGWWKALPLADAAGSWGEFGDFLGGLLNPLVAFAAFYWLTRSVQLQKKELEDTRLALEASSEAQKQQAEQSRIAVRLDALVAANAMAGDDLIDLQQRRDSLMTYAKRGDLNSGSVDAALDRIALLDQQIGELTGTQVRCRKEIREVLRRYPLPIATASETAEASVTPP
ncbi:hypothetical protein [Paracidovorax oryzae]|uniref:hypothetical protein n=1 Tax=Paracidovorax oryzae TaxID=862720 RepID=UPI00047E7E52|nr:hypothetical protein [Paracidovorax oryzae]